MRVFVTGATGFAGSHLVDQLIVEGHEVFALVRPSTLAAAQTDGTVAGWPFTPLVGDLLDAESVTAAVADARPDVIYHLAGQADVGLSWDRPNLTIALNVQGTVNLLEAAVAYGRPRMVVVTSGDVYGPLSIDAMPINGLSRPHPYHPYGVSKVAASDLIQIYHRRYDLPVIEARPFNHIGPRQEKGFVVPDFAGQIAAIKLGFQSRRMLVGNLDAERDFTDVRDMVRAYCLLAEKGTPGQIYLICSGQPVPIHYLLTTLADVADVELEITYDPDRMRPSDTPCLYGSYDKLRRDTGWQPEIHLRQSLTDVLAEWTARLQADAEMKVETADAT